MTTPKRSVLDVLRGDVAPEGSITAELGALYIYQPTTTQAVIYQKASQAAAGVADANGWVAVGQQQNAQLSAWFPPAVPNAFDDEFSIGNALAGTWRVSEGAIDGVNVVDPYAAFAGANTRISHNVMRPGWLMVQPPSTGANFTITKAMPGLPNDYAVVTRSSYDHRAAVEPVNNDFTHGIILSTEPFSANNRIQINLNESDIGVIQAEFVTVVAGVVTSIGVTADIPTNDHTPFEGCWIQKRGNTFYGWVITNNGSAISLGSTAFVPVIGCGGLTSTNAAQTTPGNMTMGFDFFRVFYTDKYHP